MKFSTPIRICEKSTKLSEFSSMISEKKFHFGKFESVSYQSVQGDCEIFSTAQEKKSMELSELSSMIVKSKP